MKLLIYILVYPLIWLFSILPFRVLYIISDILYVLIYYVFAYRKKVVLHNLKLVFPNKTATERILISKKFYSHFIDVFIEILKSFTISKKAIFKRYKYTNIEFLDELYKDGKSVILVGAHYANWEWIVSLASFVKYQGYGAFTKINNPYFNHKILKSREKFGAKIIPTSQVINEISKNHKSNIQAMYGLLSDQSPQLSRTFYWQKFLGVKVPIHTGAEMLAKRFDMNVVFIETKKIKRGHYETSFSLISNDATKYPNYQLTDCFIDKVEKQVYKEPSYYFWTHNRFKHKDKAPN